MKTIRWFVRFFPIALGLMFLAGLSFAALGHIQRVVEAEGEVRVEHFQVVRPQVPGLVVAVSVEPGDTVQQGQILFQLRDHQFERELSATGQSLEESRSRLEKLRLDLRQMDEAVHPLEIEQKQAEIARSALDAELVASQVVEAELELEAARGRHHQARELAKDGLISDQKLQENRQQELAAEQRLLQTQILERTARMQAPLLATELKLLRSEQDQELTSLRATIRELESKVFESEAQMAQLEQLQALHTLRAEFDGVLVGASPAELLGRYVEAGQDLVTIIDTASIRFWTRVPERALVQVRSGQSARVEITGLPKDRFQLFFGRVEKVFEEPDPVTENAPGYPVRIRLDAPWVNLDEERFYLRSGMRGRAKIAYQHNVPILRALYGFLTNEPQLPEQPGSKPAAASVPASPL